MQFLKSICLEDLTINFSRLFSRLLISRNYLKQRIEAKCFDLHKKWYCLSLPLH
uniref:Uncharacterized protein n=1 Tax=Rhizophora mucronata TaxID=61149 RepID=A0A2P2PAH8_RHIMU